MDSSHRRFAFRDVVLVADVVEAPASGIPIHERRNLEMTDPDTLAAVRSTIASLGLKVHHYKGPDSLARNADHHRDDVVLTIYGGESSRNRMALVPAVCETFGLRFIGPDVYGRIIAQDKELSKRLALDCGLRTPAWRVVRDERYISYATGMSLPLVIKPLLEGSSIGITQCNLVRSADEAKILARRLLEDFNQPIILEEFVPGREVGYSKIQQHENDAWAFSEITIPSDHAFFETRLFDVREKLFRTPGRTVKNIDGELDSDDRGRIDSLLRAFGTYGYCRVDGRLMNGEFFFLELTPDAWIGPRGQFAMGFSEKGWSYADVIAAVLTSVD